MKREACYALAVSMVAAPTATSIAQPAGQGGAPVAQPSPPVPAGQPAQGNESAKPAVAKQKTCEPVLIRAGPNQGQLVSKCRHRDRDAAHASG